MMTYSFSVFNIFGQNKIDLYQISYPSYFLTLVTLAVIKLTANFPSVFPISSVHLQDTEDYTESLKTYKQEVISFFYSYIYAAFFTMGNFFLISILINGIPIIAPIDYNISHIVYIFCIYPIFMLICTVFIEMTMLIFQS